jgi:predicted membrane protein
MWYILQLSVFCTVAYLYMTQITPDERLGPIFMISGVAAFAVTEIVSILIDSMRKLIRLIRSVRVSSLRRTPKSLRLRR